MGCKVTLAMPSSPRRPPAPPIDPLARLNAELQRIADAKRGAQKALQRLREARASRRRRVFDVARHIFSRTAPDLQLPLLYLAKQLSGEDAVDAMEAARDLEVWYLETDAAEVTARIDEAAASASRPAKLAKAFLAEYTIFKWVQNQNSEQGVAPPLHSILVHKRYGGNCLANLIGECSKKAFKAGEWKWGQRFRHKWGIGLGKVPVGEVIPLDTLQHKVWIESCQAPKGGPPIAQVRRHTQEKRGTI